MAVRPLLYDNKWLSRACGLRRFSKSELCPVPAYLNFSEFRRTLWRFATGPAPVGQITIWIGQ
jgi:hypothetical protein